MYLGFTFIGMNLWGSRLKEYSNFQRSLLSNIQVVIGVIPAEKMLEVSRYQTIFFVTL